MVNEIKLSHHIKPETISRFKKERFILSMSEDKFRDEVIRPLFLRKGFGDGRDVCGPFEKGKDAIFTAEDPLGMKDVYVVQTKKGNLNMAKKTPTNIVEICTQIRTALGTRVTFVATKEKKAPTKAILCASGKINDSAREYIYSEIKDPRLVFMDSDDIIPAIDEKFSEFWLGIDAEKHPYLRFIKSSVEDSDENLSISDILPSGTIQSAATDKIYVPLRLFRTALKTEKYKGQVRQVPDFQEMPVAGLLNKKDRLFLILGEAGAGKSTSLKRLAYTLAEKGLEAEDTFQIPILLRASEISFKSNLNLVEICAEKTKHVMKSTKASFTTDDLSNGKVVILIDALDELADDTCRKLILKMIYEFHQYYPKCHVIVTSRDYAYIHKINEMKYFEKYRLSPINYKEAEKIVKRLQKSKSLAKETSQEILRRLQEVHGMELNPLLVTVFAATTEYSRQDIPANITELFKKYTEIMLGRWDANKGLAHQYHAPLKDFILTKVAFAIHKQRTTNISTSEFRSIVEMELTSRGHHADIDQLFEEILYRSSLMRVNGDQVEFRHLFIQEFFAGRGIPSKEYLESIISNEWWKRAIVFYFGGNPSDHTSIDFIKDRLGSITSFERFQGALTIGLALQACYLVPTENKLNIIQWVIESLAQTKEIILKETEEEEKQYPMTKFLFYYLFGRDSVAFSVLKNNCDRLTDTWNNEEIDYGIKDARTFWLIIGLIESGSMEKAETEIKSFKPLDSRLLLGIHIGCFLIEKHRVMTKEQKHIAKKICENISSRIMSLRKQLIEEMKTELLEVRQGVIKSIDIEKTKEDTKKALPD